MKSTKKGTQIKQSEGTQKGISLLGLSGKRMVGGVLVEWDPLAYLNEGPTTSHKVYYR